MIGVRALQMCSLAQRTRRLAAHTRQAAMIARQHATIARLGRHMPGATHLTRAITAAILAERGLLDAGPAARRGRVGPGQDPGDGVAQPQDGAGRGRRGNTRAMWGDEASSNGHPRGRHAKEGRP